MVGLRVINWDNVHVALAQSTGFVNVIAAINPWIGTDCHALGQLHLLNLGNDFGVLEACLLDLEHLVDIDRALHRLGKLLEGDDRLVRQVYQAFEEAEGVEAVEKAEHDTGGRRWERLAKSFCLDVGDNIPLDWLENVESLEAQLHIGKGCL